MNRSLILIFCMSFSTLIFAQIEMIEIASGFSTPVCIANAADGSNRLFIAEQAGRIKIINDISTGNVITTPFLDINSKVTSGGERGLLGLAFHPDYPATPYFYVNYTFTESGQLKTKVERYTVSADPNEADPNSALQIIEVNQPNSNHNAGDIKFGPDGYLYITMGDGGGGGDPDDTGQDPLSLLGSLLRLDISGDDFPTDADANYKIPVSNPFAGIAGFRDEVWAIGLRNPWRISFDKQTGDLWIADVGQSDREEVNFQLAGSAGGQNYGWSCKEGTLPMTFNECLPGILTDPIFEYPRSQGQSITGGFVYRGAAFPDLQGFYIVIDYAFGNLWMINSTDVNDVQMISSLNLISSFGESESGELYACRLNNGRVYRLFNTSVCEDIVEVVEHEEDEYRADVLLQSNIPVDSDRNITYASPQIEISEPFEVASQSTFEAESITCVNRILQDHN